MARPEFPHFEHHRREIELTRQRFQLTMMALFVAVSVVVGVQYLGSHALSNTPEIKSGITDKCLDDYQSGTANNNKVDIWSCNGSTAQQWAINSDKTVRIHSKCLDVNAQGTTNGTLVNLYSCNGGNNQKWNYTNHTLVGVQSGKCLDDPSSSTTNGTHVQIWTCNGTNAQKWTSTVFTDTVPPTVPANLHITGVTGSSVGMAWAASTDGFGVKGYYVYRDGTRITLGNVNSFTDTGLAAGSTHTYQVAAYDAAGNVSGKSNSAVATTTAPPPPPHPTPTPGGGGGGSGGGGSGGGGGGSTGGGGGSTGQGGGGSTAPGQPQGFSATVSDNGVVSLSWSPSEDIAGIKSYQLERSVDQSNWTVLSSDIEDTNYLDSTAAFGVHYYYRVQAMDNNGLTSDYALADAVTPAFQGSASSGSSSTFTSDDQVASVTIPSGAMDTSADCSVAKDDNTHPNSGSKKTVVGPYAVICKALDGTQITAFSQPLAWSVNIKGKLKGLKNPGVYTMADTGNVSAVTNAKYDAKSGVMTFSSTTTNSVLVLADVSPGVPWNLVAMVLLLVGVVGGVFVLILRRQQKASYDDYLRKKYYNL